jgi:very-short-patch-repair endonuclease
MDETDIAIARLAASQHGTLSIEQAAGLGIGASAVARRLASGLLVPVHRGVYRHAAAPLTPKSLVMAAVLAGGEAALASHRTAAWLHGVDGAWPGAPEIVHDGAHTLHIPGVRTHRTRQLDPADRVLIHGIRATSMARTLLDLGAVSPFERVEHQAQDAVIRGLATIAQLLAILDRVGRRGRNGTAILRAVVAQSLPDERIQSKLEAELHDLLRRAAVPAPILQHPVVLPNGRNAFIDFAWPERMIAVEADGRRWHATKRDFEQGLVRRRQLRMLGWDVSTYGWSDVVDAAESVVFELRSLLLARPTAA